jgi:hypothetical protein
MAIIEIAFSDFRGPFPGLCNGAIRPARHGGLPFDKGRESIMVLVLLLNC